MNESLELVAKMCGDRTAFAVSPAKAIKRKVRKPPRPNRRLRVYALDPSVGKSLTLCPYPGMTSLLSRFGLDPSANISKLSMSIPHPIKFTIRST